MCVEWSKEGISHTEARGTVRPGKLKVVEQRLDDSGNGTAVVVYCVPRNTHGELHRVTVQNGEAVPQEPGNPTSLPGVKATKIDDLRPGNIPWAFPQQVRAGEPQIMVSFVPGRGNSSAPRTQA